MSSIQTNFRRRNPKAVHIIIRSVGEYERTETPIRAFTTAKGASDFARLAEKEWAMAVAAVPDDVDYPADGASDEEWEKWARRKKQAWGKFRRFLTCDKKAGPVGEWSSPDEPSYYRWVIPLTESEVAPPPGYLA